MTKKTINAIVEGGKASAGPPLGPALGQAGVNSGQVIAKINEVTTEFNGMKVPVAIEIDTETKEFVIEVGSPATSEMIKKELGIAKGRTEKGQIAGDITIEQAIKVATLKKGGSLAIGIKNLTNEVLGACVSMGVTCKGKHPKEVSREINEGKHDSLFAGK